MSNKNIKKLIEVKKECDTAYESYMKAKDHFLETFEKSLKKNVPDFEKRLDRTLKCISDFIDEDRYRYVTDIDVLLTLQWLMTVEV